MSDSDHSDEVMMTGRNPNPNRQTNTDPAPASGPSLWGRGQRGQRPQRAGRGRGPMARAHGRQPFRDNETWWNTNQVNAAGSPSGRQSVNEANAQRWNPRHSPSMPYRGKQNNRNQVKNPDSLKEKEPVNEATAQCRMPEQAGPSRPSQAGFNNGQDTGPGSSKGKQPVNDWDAQRTSAASGKWRLNQTDQGTSNQVMNSGSSAQRNSQRIDPSQHPVSASRAPYKTAPQEALEYLAKLAQPIVARAHLNRYGGLDVPDGNPAYLAKVRQGPGIDPSSEAFETIESHRQFGGITIPRGEPKHPDLGTSEGYDRRRAYIEDTEAYPIIEDGKVVLSATPGPEFIFTPKREAKHITFVNIAAGSKKTAATDLPAENRWAYASDVDWKSRSVFCSRFEGFRDLFRVWLEHAFALSHGTANIYRESFFDGTAHADGSDFVLANLEYPDTKLNMEDEATRLHCHESSAGYSFNWVLREKMEKQGQLLSEKMEIEAQKLHKNQNDERVETRIPQVNATRTESPVPSPKNPMDNFYLRPAGAVDILQLTDLYNWYILNSPLHVEIDPLTPLDIRDTMEQCSREKLPFIVAVERRTELAPGAVAYTPEKVVGYAFATDFMGPRTLSRHVAELEVFVKKEYKRNGIGRSLVDKLIEICDATYEAKQDYFFQASTEDGPAYSSGGRRRMLQLIFQYAVSPENPTEYQWVKNWLQHEFGFELRGVLKDARVKDANFYDLCYFSRTALPKANSWADSETP